MPDTPDEILSVITELVEQDALATITVPEKERVGRTPTAAELARPESGPNVMIEDSLWQEPEPHGMAIGTIPPPIAAGPYCVLEPIDDTEKIERVADADDVLDALDYEMIDSGPRAFDDDHSLELDIELEIAFDDLDDL